MVLWISRIWPTWELVEGDATAQSLSFVRYLSRFFALGFCGRTRVVQAYCRTRILCVRNGRASPDNVNAAIGHVLVLVLDLHVWTCGPMETGQTGQLTGGG